MRVVKQIYCLIGPIMLSALSLLVTFLILQPLACWLDPTFNLLASRGIGKIVFTTLVIFQIFLLLTVQSYKFFQQFLKTNIYFFAQKKWLQDFFKYFCLFFLLHSLLLILFWVCGFANYNATWGKISFNLLGKILFGFIATFFLAWTEELIFRGTLYPYFAQQLKPLPSLLTTSLIFMFVHKLWAPLDLIGKEWQLGLGLFLLGTLLNLIFISTKKLYTGMGAHAGLVFVKVILRRTPLLIFISPERFPFWVTKDLRMSPLIHLLFFIVIIILAIKSHKELFKSPSQS